MSHWSHRVVRQKHKSFVPGVEPEITYSIHEAFYDDGDTEPSVTLQPSYPQGETLDDLRQVLTMMLEALDKPVIEYDESK